MAQASWLSNLSWDTEKQTNGCTTLQRCCFVNNLDRAAAAVTCRATKSSGAQGNDGNAPLLSPHQKEECRQLVLTRRTNHPRVGCLQGSSDSQEKSPGRRLPAQNKLNHGIPAARGPEFQSECGPPTILKSLAQLVFAPLPPGPEALRQPRERGINILTRLG